MKGSSLWKGILFYFILFSVTNSVYVSDYVKNIYDALLLIKRASLLVENELA